MLTDPSNQQHIDRLVDGEATADEARRLFEQFDQSPDGWRRLALTFVESAGLRNALGELTRSSGVGSAIFRNWPIEHCEFENPVTGQFRKIVDATPLPSPPSRRRLGVRLAGAACVAAGLLAAFAAGRATVVSPSGSIEPGDVPPSLAVSQPPARSGDPAPDGDDVKSTGKAVDAADDPEEETLSVVFTDPQTSASRTVQVPVVDSSAVDPEWLTDAESVVPDSVRAALSRLGHQVHVERRLYPVDLGDGRQVLLPVDDVQVQFVGQREYQ